MGFIQVDYHGVHTLGPENFHCALLRWKEKNRVIPIWISPIDAEFLEARDAGYQSKRPNAHDLLAESLTRLGSGTTQINIVSYFEGVFIASIVTESGQELDARPSDALILARLLNLPVMIDEEVAAQTSVFLADTELQDYLDIEPSDVLDDTEILKDEDFEQFMESMGVFEKDLFSDDDDRKKD
ncbi:MAG: bifunctional nuclease family protein [Corynebacterium sp.]|nr:bifunctional nuclease family protein [Corynebacterium sp.]